MPMCQEDDAMSAMIRVTATVLPGGKLEVVVPELQARVGETVEVDVPVPAPAPGPTDLPKSRIYDLIQSLPPGPRSAESFEEIERQFQEMRDEWDR